MMDYVTLAFYVLVFIGFVQIDRRLYDIVRALKKMTEPRSKTS